MNLSSSRLLIADDHRLFNDAVTGMLQPLFGQISQVFSGTDLIPAIHRYNPDLLLLDINLPNLNGLEAARTIRQDVPNLKIILVTMYNHTNFVTEAKSLKLEGYLLKDSPSDVLIQGIYSVLEGNHFFDPKLQNVASSTDDFVKETILSRREKEIIQGLVQGKTAEQLATDLCIAYETVKSHRKNIYLKLGISSIVELIHLSHNRGWS